MQRVGIGEAFQLPASLLSFGGTVGQPLSAPVRQKMESFFGTSFADVRVHVGPQAPSIGALAFTHGSNLYFAPGQYNPNTAHGQQLLAHELTHVVQQRAGRVRNPFGSGIAVVQDRGMEAEAERMGQRLASHKESVQAKTAHSRPFPSTTRLRARAIQRTPEESESLEKLGRIWHSIAEHSPKSKEKEDFFKYVEEISQKLGFKAYTVFHKHDLYIGGGKNKNYVKIVNALQGGNAGKTTAELYIGWAEGGTTIDQLPKDLQELIIIVHVAEVGRGYTYAPLILLKFMKKVSEASKKERKELWSNFKKHNVYAYTAKEDPDYDSDAMMEEKDDDDDDD